MIRSRLSALLFAAVAVAQTKTPQLEDLLPASTYAVLRHGGHQAMARAIDAMPMAGVVRDFLAKLPAELRASRFERGLDEGVEQIREVLQHLSLAGGDLRSLLSKPIVLAMGRLTLEGMGPSLALLLEAGDERAAFDRCWQALERQLAQHGVPVQAAAEEVAGMPVRTVRFGLGTPPVFVGEVAGALVVTNSRGYLAEIGRVARGQQPALSRPEVAGLQRVMAELPGPALGSLFVNLRSVMAMFDAHLPYEAAELARALGVAGLDSLYYGFAASRLGGCDLVHLGIPGSQDGLCKAVVGKPVDLALARLCSANTVLFAASSFDVPAALDAWQRVLDLLPGGLGSEVRSEMGRDLARELRHLGMQPAELETLLRAFGNQVGFAVSLEKGAIPKPELLARIAVRDPAPVQALLQRLEAAVAQHGLEWKERQVGADSIRFVALPLDLGEQQLQVSPCYVLRGGELLLGSDVLGMVRALKQAERPAESFAEQPDFATVAAESRGKSGVLHLRWFRAADLGWRTVEQFGFPWLDSHRDELGFGSDALPEAEAMAQALGTNTMTFAVDATGVLFKNHGTLSYAALLAVGGTVLDEVLRRASVKVY